MNTHLFFDAKIEDIAAQQSSQSMDEDAKKHLMVSKKKLVQDTNDFLHFQMHRLYQECITLAEQQFGAKLSVEQNKVVSNNCVVLLRRVFLVVLHFWIANQINMVQGTAEEKSARSFIETEFNQVSEAQDKLFNRRIKDPNPIEALAPFCENLLASLPLEILPVIKTFFSVDATHCIFYLYRDTSQLGVLFLRKLDESSNFVQMFGQNANNVFEIKSTSNMAIVNYTTDEARVWKRNYLGNWIKIELVQ